MEYLGNGLGRVVYKVNENMIVKIPYNNDGILQNKDEYEKYNNSKHNLFAKIIRFDTENNWLYMEFIKDCSDDFDDYTTDKTHCTKYDDSIEPTIILNCDKKCIGCKFNKCKTFDDNVVKEIIANKTKDRLQVGFDKNNNLKIFDYANIHTETKFIFDERYIEAFNKYIESKSKKMFEDVVKIIDAKPVNFDKKIYQNANKFKRKRYIKHSD